MEKNRTNNIGEININKLIVPGFIELALHALVGNIDQVMLSGYNTTAVAAVGNANMIMAIVILLFNVICTSTSILVSRSLGAKDYENTSRTYGVAILVNLILSIGVTLFVVSLIEPIYTLLKVPSELMPEAISYMGIVALSIPIQALLLTFFAIFRANAMMNITMKISIFFNIINIIGNAILINGLFGMPTMGASGVAISTVISKTIGLVICIAVFRELLEKQNIEKFNFKTMTPFPKDIFKEMMGIGLPSAGENLSWNFAQLVSMSFINSMGTVSITAKMYCTILSQFCYMYAVAAGQASQIVVGYEIGAGQLDRAYNVGKKTLRKAAPVSLFLAVLICLFSNQLYGLLTDNSDILRLAFFVSIVAIPLEFGRAFNIVYIRCMQASGDVIFPIIVGVSAQWIVSVGFGYICGVVLDWGLVGIWIGFMADECVRAVIYWARWHKGTWRKFALEKINKNQ